MLNRLKIFYFWNISIILKPNAFKLHLYWCEACVWKSDAIFFVWLFSSCFFCSRRSVNKTWRNSKQQDGRAKTREDWVASRRVVHCTLQTQTSLVFFLLRYRRVVSPHASFYQLDTRNTMVYFLLINILFLGIDLENISQQAEAIFGGST